MGLRCLLCALLLLWAPQVLAVPVAFLVTGTITEIQDTGSVFAGTQIFVGAPFTGEIAWDTALADTESEADRGLFVADPAMGQISLSMTVGGVQVAGDPLREASILTNNDRQSGASSGPVDLLVISSFNAIDNVPDMVGNLRAIALQFVLSSLNLSALAGESLPTTLDLSMWSSTRDMSFTAVRSGADGLVIGEVETLTLVPEPSTALLFGLGVAVAISVRQRRR